MTATPSIAVAHYPEGAGHATRMLAIAEELRSAGADVEMAGGGPGARFVALNGYEAFEPATVDYIDTYQDGSMRRVLAESVPATVDRVTDYVEWLRDGDHDAIVTDDMFAAMAAIRADVPLYALKHDMPGLYRDPIERAGAAFHTRFQLAAARALFCPTVWPGATGGPSAVTRVPPVALDGDGDPSEPVDVLAVPSHYSTFDRITAALRRQGYDVIDVGADDWDPVASLLPYLRAADVVVCSGYSTVMDAAVAGTPCVVHPATDEQEAVAARLDRADATGFAVAEEPLDVLEAVAAPPAPPAAENGAPVVADAVLADLQRDDSADGPRPDPVPEDADDRTATAGAAVVPDRPAPAGTWARARRDPTAAALRAARRTRSAAGRLRDRAAAIGSGLRATAASCRRWAVAAATLGAVLLVYSRWSARRAAARLATDAREVGRALRSVAARGLRGLRSLRAGAADGVLSLLGGLGRLGRRIADGARSAE